MKRDQALKPGGFDEHERDTAQRAYPQDIVDSSRGDVHRPIDGTATTKIARVDLEAVLRKESGTRPAVTREEIERFKNRASPADDIQERATVTAVPRSVIEAAEAPAVPTARPISVIPAPAAIEIPIEEERVSTSGIAVLPIAARSFSLREEPKTTSHLPRWVLPVVAIGMGIVVSLAFTGGFVLGRVSALH